MHHIKFVVYGIKRFNSFRSCCTTCCTVVAQKQSPQSQNTKSGYRLFTSRLVIIGTKIFSCFSRPAFYSSLEKNSPLPLFYRR